MSESFTPPPSLTRPAYWVMLAPADTDPNTVTDDSAETVHVVVNAGDQLRGELEAGQVGLRDPAKLPFHLTALWLWSALVRTGHIDYRFPEFKQRLLAYEPDKAAADAGADVVHPTVASTG